MIALAIVLIVIGCCTLGYVMGYSVGHRDGVRWVHSAQPAPSPTRFTED